LCFTTPLQARFSKEIFRFHQLALQVVERGADQPGIKEIRFFSDKGKPPNNDIHDDVTILVLMKLAGFEFLP
jgi:hypothetical protein